MNDFELLTPDDKLVKDRISRKSRRRWSPKEYERRRARLDDDDCNHPSIKFFVEDCTFRCMKCNEKLVKCNSINEFRLFCELSGSDPKTFIA